MKTKILLDENEMPKKWYNILPDLPKPLDPPLHPGTHEPLERGNRLSGKISPTA